MSITIVLLALIIILIAAVIGLFVFFNSKLSQLAAPNDDKTALLLFERIKELNQTMDSSIRGLNQTMDSKLTESSRQMQTQFGQSINIIKGVTEKVTQLQETNKQVMGFS
ncbi:MAG: hypothetical protein WCT16_01670 [Candidatus Buchananbacteria bacterium]